MPKHDIPYVNLSAQYNNEREKLLPIIDAVLSAGVYIGGETVERLEGKIAKLCDAKYAISLNSGTDALMLGMSALGIKRGDEVITPPNSFIASTASIAHIGAVPVFVDVRPDQNIDPEQIRKAITHRTKAIMPVHLTGRIADMASIREIASEHKLFIIEDAAQAIGSKFCNKPAGGWGDIGCFSTHPLKNLNAIGDGGFLTTNNDAVAEKARLYRNHGLVDRNTVLDFGLVSRMDALQAAILEFRLENLPMLIQKRRHNASLYRSLLDQRYVFIPPDREDEYNTFHTFVIQVHKRDELQEFLRDNGVGTAIHYPIPIHLQPAARNLGYKRGDFPVTEAQANRILTLPVHQSLSEQDVKIVAELVNSFYKS